MIKVLVVEDSAVVRDLLLHILGSDRELQVVGTASDGEEALRAVERDKPDVITMDIHMPGMNGFDATRRIMETHPTPIVIVSGTPDVREQVIAFRAMEAGALAVLPASVGFGHPEHEQNAANLVQVVKLMSEVKLVRRWARQRSQNLPAPAPYISHPTRTTDIAVVAIGASTGGPLALQNIVSRFPANFPVPVLVVQHIAPGFADGFVAWLSQSSPLTIQLAVHGDPVIPGRIYVAPDGHHMKVAAGGRILLSLEAPANGLRPSVACLFRSVAAVYGKSAAGVLLSGMGKDGARELKLMRDQGCVTVAQDRETSVVHGMPGEAIRLEAATYILPAEKIAATLVNLVQPATSCQTEQGANDL